MPPCLRVLCCWKQASPKVDALREEAVGGEIFVGVRSNAGNLKVINGKVSDSATSQMTSDGGNDADSEGCHQISSLQVS